MERLLRLVLIIFSIIILSTTMVLAEEPVAPAGGPAIEQAAAPPPDPSGANTGGAADVIRDSANAPTADDLKNLGPKEPLAAKLVDVIGHNRIAINIVWTLT